MTYLGPGANRSLPLASAPPTAAARALGLADGLEFRTLRELLDRIAVAEDPASHALGGYAQGLRLALADRQGEA